MIHLIAYKPYPQPFDNNLEIINEFCVTSLISFFFVFANPGIIGQAKENMGYFCILIIMTTLVINWLASVRMLRREIPLVCRRCFNLLSATAPEKLARI